MRSHGTLVSCVLGVVLCAAIETAYGQQTTTTADVDAALATLRSTAAYERAAARADVVKHGELALDPLVTAVAGRETAEDTNFVLNCVIALGEIADARATDTLVQVLGESNMPMALAAARSLGQIWEGTNAGTPEVQKVNAALLALLHSELPEVGVYMPGVALVQINTIPLARPHGLPVDELRAGISDWFTRNPDALPAPGVRPWQLNAYMALHSQNAAAREAAVSALQQQRPLGAIDATLEAMAAGTTVTPDLRNLLADLSGVPFPPRGVPDDADLVTQIEQWRWQWLARLATQTDRRHVDYALSGLEGALQHYVEAPTDEAAEPVRFFRAALLSQLSDPDAVPATVSPKARTMLNDPLERKRIIQDAVATLAEVTAPLDKTAQLRIIQAQIRHDTGREVGMMFLSPLFDRAYREETPAVAGDMGEVLSRIRGIPVALKNISLLDMRQARLDRWLTEVQRLGLALEATGG